MSKCGCSTATGAPPQSDAPPGVSMKLKPMKRQLSALGVYIKLAHPSKGLPTCRMSPGLSVPVLT
jgi:hypothetical protein